MSIPKHHFIINLLMYQACWFTCVLSAAKSMPWIGATLVVIIIGYHLLIVTRPMVELALIVFVTIGGGVWDSMLVAMGWLQYPSGMFIDNVAPYWIFSLWASFAITLNVSLRWFKQHLWLSSLFGAIGGPLAFLAGERLGAVVFPDMILALSVLGLGWALLMPTTMLLARYFNGLDQVTVGCKATTDKPSAASSLTPSPNVSNSTGS